MKTVKQVANELKVHPATVKIWIREGKLKAKITPRGYVIKEDDLNDFLIKHSH